MSASKRTGVMTSALSRTALLRLMESTRLLVEKANPDETVANLRDLLVGAGGLYKRGGRRVSSSTRYEVSWSPRR